MDWTAVISGAVSGSIVGVAASLVAPWSSWKVEKRRLKLAARREMVASWRRAVKEAEDMDAFRESPGYAAMRPYLLRTLIERIESDAITVQRGGRGAGVNNFKPVLYDDITRIEKYWDLI